MSNKIFFRYGGQVWTVIYNESYEITELLDGDDRTDFLSVRAVEKAESLVFERMMTDKKYRRRTKPLKEVKDGEE